MIVPVLGCPRGGTTAVAGILQILGVDMGYPLSDYTIEDLTLRQRHPHLLAELCWTRGDQGPAWGWKDPTLIDRWHTLAPLLVGLDVRPVVVMRDPHAIACTEGREPSGIGYGQALVAAIPRLHALVGVADSVTVSYEHVIRDPLRVAGTIIRHLHLDPPIGTEAAIVRWIDPDRGYADSPPAPATCENAAHQKLPGWCCQDCKEAASPHA